MKTREDAKRLLESWVESPSLRAHCLGVAVCMEAYAKKLNLGQEEVDTYWITGLLHDFDWERHPTIEDHPRKGCEYLRENGWDDVIVRAILGHNPACGVARESLMAKTLFAIDELSGLVIALAKIRPGNFEGMAPKSVKKALKKKDFAAAVSRDEVRQGMEELGIAEDGRDAYFQLIIDALRVSKKELGFDA